MPLAAAGGWIVGVIFVAIWIIATIARNVSEAKEKPAPKPRPTPRPPERERERERQPDRERPAARRGGATTINRFQQELERLREKGEKPKSRPRPPVLEEIPEALPVFEEPRHRLRPSEEAPAEVQARVRVSEVPVPSMSSIPMSDMLPTRQIAADTRIAARQATPAAVQLMKLLSAPDTVRAAFLLKEVLGTPRCRQR